MAATLRREVLRGQLLHRRKGNSSWKRRLVVLYCGSQSDGKNHSAVLHLHGDYEKPGKKPNKILELAKAKIDSSSGSPPNSHSNSPYNTMSMSPYTSSPLGTSPSYSSSVGVQQHIFQVVLTNETNEFKAENEDDRLKWIKLLGLLIMFPHSVIPEEPANSPIKESFRVKLDPKFYHADSVWAVYILPEEVGSRCHIIGTMVLALRSGVPNKQVGRLDIFNPIDPANPMVSWDQDKMRRTGKTGNLVFIEIGRRCQGGPGLVWMHAGNEESQALRQTLHKFLFHGDGKAVAIPTQQTSLYDVPHHSYDSNSLPPSRPPSSASDNYVIVPGPIKDGHHMDPDSGYLSQSASNSLPHSLEGHPPPVRLDKHPSIRRKRSTPCDIQRQVSRDSATSGSFNDKEMFGQSADSLDQNTMFEERDSSESPPDASSTSCIAVGMRRTSERSSYAEDIAGDMEPEAPYDLPPSSHYDVPRRAYSAPSTGLPKHPHIAQRHHSTSECEHANRAVYETMVHPKAAILQQDEYIRMRPSELRAQLTSHPISISGESQAHRPLVPTPVAQLQSPTSAEMSVSPRARLLYDRLPPIREGGPAERAEPPPQPRLERQGSQYENHPLPPEVAGAETVVYQPNYENVHMAQSGRRGSLHDDQYENVTLAGEQITATPPRTGSLRRSASLDKEDVRLPFLGNKLTIGGQQVKSSSPSSSLTYADVVPGKYHGDHINPTIKAVDYAKVTVPRTNGFPVHHEDVSRGLSDLQLVESN